MESNFVELLSRETKLEEVQAYVLLRQPLLSQEDDPVVTVVKSFGLLGWW